MCLPIAFFFVIFHQASSAKILCVLTAPSYSHASIFQPIYKELSLRGHQVTVLTPSPLNDKTLTNLTEIEIRKYDNIIRFQNGKALTFSKDIFSLLDMVSFADFVKEFTEETLTKVKGMFPNEEFDLLLLEELSPLVYSLGCRFKVPIVSMCATFLLSITQDLLGNVDHPILYQDSPPMTEDGNNFYEKILNVVFNVIMKLCYHWFYLPRVDETAKRLFGEDCPRIDKIMKNVSLMLTNTQLPLQLPRPQIPTIVEIGGSLQIQQEKPLPKDLQTYLDQSSQGVIYFCLGSIHKSTELPEALLNIIIQALSELPYNVLWKFETNYLPNRPKNVMIRKWVPQQDVLRHKNVKAFITHAGLLSVREAVFSSVPLVGIPLATDQYEQARVVVDLGIGVKIDYSTMTKNVLKDAVIEVAENIKYKNAIRDVGKLLRDRQMKSLDKAVWWIEYVIRHNGAHHLKSDSTFSSWYEYYLIDSIATILLLVVVVLYLIRLCIRCSKICIEVLGKMLKSLFYNK